MTWIPADQEQPEDFVPVLVKLAGYMGRHEQRVTHVVAMYCRPGPMHQSDTADWYEPLSDEEIDVEAWMHIPGEN